jgi:opacity protein-like surface antigen
LRLPLTEAFEADLRLGDYFGKTTYDNYLSVGPNADFVGPSNSGSSLLAGVGAAYNMAGHYSIRLDYLRIEHTGGGDAGAKFDVNLVTAGLSYSF